MQRSFNYLCLLVLLGMIVCPVQSWAQTHTERIAVVVNQDAISSSDVSARTQLIMISSGMPQNTEMREKLKQQVTKILIEEQIKVQEASRLKIDIREDEIEEGFRAIAAQNNMSKDQFFNILKEGDIPIRTLKDQIRSQIAWGHIIQQRLRQKVDVPDIDIESMRDRLASNTGKTEYLLSEIFLPVESLQDEKNVRQLANKLRHQLMTGSVPFTRLAIQFSQSSTAAQGGDLGWVQEGILQEKIDDQIARMEEGDLSQPVRSLSGYHIMLLRKKRMISEDSIPSLADIGTRLGMEQLERLQRRYLLELKASAFIEHRV